MPFKYEINGQLIEFDKEPTEVDIDEAAAQLSGQQQTGFTQTQFPETPSIQQQTQGLQMPFFQKAALRTQLAFGEDPTYVQNWLQQKFPDREIKRIKGRQFSIDGIPIDPRGLSISDFPFDVLDTADEIIRIGGQIFGATKGAAVGATLGAGAGGVGAVPGAGIGLVVGGGLGRGGGQATVETIGRFFGVQGGEGIAEVAKDIARETAIGATAEAGGLALRAISKPTVSFLKNFGNKILGKAGKSTEQFVLNFTGGMSRENIARLQNKGANAILTKTNLDDDALLRVGQKIQNAAISKREELGKAVEIGKGIIKNRNKAIIDITDIRNDFGTKLQNAYLLNKNFKPMKPAIGKLDAGQKELLRIWKLLKKKQKISPSTALKWRVELDRIVKFSQAGKFVTTDFENSIALGMRAQLKQKLIEISDEFAKANADFSAFASIEDMLKGKLDTKSVENFLKSTITGQHIYQESLEKLNQALPIEEHFIENLYDILAARDFASTTFRGIRSGIMMSILGGLGLVSTGPAGALQGAAAGIVLSTPRFAGRAIGVRQAGARFIEALLKRANQGALTTSPKAVASILSRLLAEKK